MHKRTALAAVAALALVAPLSASWSSAAAARADAPASPFAVSMPRTQTVPYFHKHAFLQASPRVLAGAEKLELRAHRTPDTDSDPATDYGPIQVTWERPGGAVTLPAGTMEDFSGLQDFFRIEVRGSKGALKGSLSLPFCPGEETQRARPDAEAHNPYPQGCPANPFTLGSVMGVPAGWATTGESGFADLRLTKDHDYTMTTTVAPKYRAMSGLADADASATTVLQVRKVDDETEGRRLAARAAQHSTASRHTSTTVASRPAARPATRPATATSGEPPAGASLPDLRSLPAFGMRISSSGNYLQFAATVWNGGDGPMVVDGYRKATTDPEYDDRLDAYQYFFAADGTQQGYTQVGQMEWDPRASHHHWHFTDFARYRLLNVDQSLAVASEKEAFCLANTDAVDYTIPFANWNPDGTDLGTACGDHESVAVRESLETGSGDTYDQSRAGQSFDLRKVKNGTYYISVEANPEHRLIEKDTANNDALRKITIGGTPGHRTVASKPVGLVDDRYYQPGY